MGNNKYMTKKQIIVRGFAQAVSAVGYIVIVVTFMQNAERLFKDRPESLAGIFMLTLFVISVAIMAIIVFGKPALLYFEGQKKEGVSLVLYTIGFLVLIFVVFGTIFLLF